MKRGWKLWTGVAGILLTMGLAIWCWIQLATFVVYHTGGLRLAVLLGLMLVVGAVSTALVRACLPLPEAAPAKKGRRSAFR